MKKNIKQLMPATNWWVRYKDDEGKIMEGKVFYERVSFFALCEDEYGLQDIIPVTYDYFGHWNFIVKDKTNYMLGCFYSEKQQIDGEVQIED
jgi:hypothetical protein